MILVADIGNTKISLGLYKKGLLKDLFSFVYPKNISTENLVNNLEKFIQKVHIENCIISSVVEELTEPVKASILQLYGVESIILNTDLNLGINLKVQEPEKLGTDRIANAYAASKLYNERPLIVVDSGSATTFDIIDKDNKFIGGLIMPGLDMQLKSLYEKTSKLPELKLSMVDKVQTVINNDTQNSILSGVVIGHAQAIQGLITICEKELQSKAYIVGCGGNAILLSKYMNYRKFDIINPNLTLDGIYMIYELNKD